MKRFLSVLLVCLLVVTGLAVTPDKAAADTAKTYTLGKEVSGNISYDGGLYGLFPTYSTDTYTFNVASAMDIVIEFTSASARLEWTLSGGSPSVYKWDRVDAGLKKTYKYYVQPGAYSFKVTGYTGGASDYKFKLSNSNNYNVKFASKSGKVDGGLKKTIAFTYGCSYEYAEKNFKIKNSKAKVAGVTYTLKYDGTGTITLDPKKIGKTKVTISLAGGNSASYTATVKSMYVFVAKGSSVKLVKPIGIKSPKWKSNKKKVVSVKKGKIKAKKGGRATITASKGKTKFKYNIIVTDYIQLGKKAYREIKENVRNPEKFKVYNVYKGYDKNIVDGLSIPVLFIDYGYPNSYGELERAKVIVFYDDVHEMKAIGVNSYVDVIKRKTVPVSKIKN
ncbi:MAG: hypothetical protein K6G65_03055 [Lachnospiraceae bacterium]|nr:hypothetical protein [Lachnospiraceae bacterium]